MKGFIAAAALLASALRIAAQPVDTSVVERASQALENANRKLSERTALPSGATIARVRFGREDPCARSAARRFSPSASRQGRCQAPPSPRRGSRCTCSPTRGRRAAWSASR